MSDDTPDSNISSPGASSAGDDLPPHKVTFQRRLMGRLRGYFLAGVLITAPIGITLYLAWLVVTFIDSLATGLLPERYDPNSYLPFAVPGIGVLLVVVGLTLIGAITAGIFGRLLINSSERLLARMPVVRNVYGAVKQIFETVLARQSTAFRDVVLIEYPRRDMWAMGFLTGVTRGEVQEMTDDEVVNVFLPTTPNPTSGYLLFVKRREVKVLKMSVEEGIKMVISGGIVTPPEQGGPFQRTRHMLPPDTPS